MFFRFPAGLAIFFAGVFWSRVSPLSSCLLFLAAYGPRPNRDPFSSGFFVGAAR